MTNKKIKKKTKKKKGSEALSFTLPIEDKKKLLHMSIVEYFPLATYIKNIISDHLEKVDVEAK